MDLTRRIITGTKFCVLLKKKKGPLRIFLAALLLCFVGEKERTVPFFVFVGEKKKPGPSSFQYCG
jgi:hypothetical protein